MGGDPFGLLLRQRVIFMGGEVNDFMADALISQLLLLDSQAPDQVGHNMKDDIFMQYVFEGGQGIGVIWNRNEKYAKSRKSTHWIHVQSMLLCVGGVHRACSALYLGSHLYSSNFVTSIVL